MPEVICPYCDKPAPLVTGKVVYPHRRDLWKKKLYRCNLCDAHVGCYPGSDKPLGVPAGPILRAARIKAHFAFDPLWRGDGKKMFRNRSHAYKWLAKSLGISRSRCHIGQFDKEQCEDTIAACQGKRELESEPNAK